MAEQIYVGAGKRDYVPVDERTAVQGEKCVCMVIR